MQQPHLKTHSTTSASLALHFVVIHYAWIYTTKWKKRFIAFLWIAFFFLLLQMASANDARYGQKESADQNFDYMFKILIIGNSSVGKTSFLFRYADDSFTPAFVSTVGIDFKVKTIYRNDKRIKLQIWVSFLSVSFFLSASVLSFRVRSVLLKEQRDIFTPTSVYFRTLLGRRGTGPSPQHTIVEQWASFWCMTSPTRIPLMPFRTGMRVLIFVSGS